MVAPVKKIQRCDIGEWRRYRNTKSHAVIAIHKTKRDVRALPVFAHISVPITRAEAAKALKEVRNA